MNIRRHSRSGVALLWALVVLSVLGTMSILATREFAIARRTLAIRQNRIQAEWLARSGAELAVARLLADEGYTGGTVEPIATGPVEIKVEKDPTKTGVFHIRCEANFPVGDYRVVRFTLSRTATRRTDGGKVTVGLKVDE